MEIMQEEGSPIAQVGASGGSLSIVPDNTSWTSLLQNQGLGIIMSRICKTFSQIGASSIIISIMLIILITIIMIMNMIMLMIKSMIMIMTLTMVSYHHHEAPRAVRGSVSGCSMDMRCPYGIGRGRWDKVVLELVDQYPSP